MNSSQLGLLEAADQSLSEVPTKHAHVSEANFDHCGALLALQSLNLC